jgi:hypothetical protein
VSKSYLFNSLLDSEPKLIVGNLVDLQGNREWKDLFKCPLIDCQRQKSQVDDLILKLSWEGFVLEYLEQVNNKFFLLLT